MILSHSSRATTSSEVLGTGLVSVIDKFWSQI